MALAPAPAAMDVDDEGAGGGSRNQSSVVVAKSKAVCSNAGPKVVGPEPVEDVGGDTTECSSSFGDTCSGVHDVAGGGEPEVNFGMAARAGGGRSWKPPRKKVTAEWRNSVRPILWRCQWLELRMRELSSQVLKYDRELALNKKQKELQAASKADGSLSESMQIHQGHGNSIMKRRKWKRHEENLDTPLYINKHQILSYYHVPIRGGLDRVTLLDPEDYDVIFEQLSLKDILLTIDGVQSQVHLLQDRLRKAHSEGRNLAFYEGNAHVRVAQKRQHTQKRSSYTECRYTKPQKKKNLNILLKDDNGPALSGRPSLPDRETDNNHIKDANWTAEERSGEGKHSREKAITVGLLLGIGNAVPNGYVEDLCKENTDHILIDNRATNDICEQFDMAKLLPSGTFKDQSISVLVEVKNTCAPVKFGSTCAPVEVDTICALAVEKESSVVKSAPVSSGSKQELKKGSLFTKKQRKVASKTPGTPSAANSQTESTPVAVAKQKTEGTYSAATGPQTMTACSAGKKYKSVNEPTDAKERGSRNSFSALTEQKTGKPSSAMKRKEASETPAVKKKTESMNTMSAANIQTERKPSAVAKQKTEGTRSAAAGPETMTAHSAGKKLKSVNEPADAKEYGSWNMFSASTEQQTGKPFSAMKRKEAPRTLAAKEKTEGMHTLSAANTQTESMPSAVAKQKTDGTRSAATRPETMAACSAGKKRKSVNEPADAKEHGSWILFSASTEQKAGKPFSAMKRKEASKTPAAKEKTEGMDTLSAANTQTKSMLSAVAKQKTEGTRSSATGPETMKACSAVKKRKSVNERADAKEDGSWNLFSALAELKTGKPSSAVKKQRTEKSSIVAKKHGPGNMSSPWMEQKTGRPSSAVKKQKIEKSSTAANEHGFGNMSSPSMEQKNGKPSSAVKKQQIEKSSTAAKEHGSGSSSSASKEQKTGKGSSTVKQQETELSAAADKQEAESASLAKKEQVTENSSSKAKKAETASAPLKLKLQVEKALPVAVDSRRSQRVRKPKVFAE